MTRTTTIAAPRTFVQAEVSYGSRKVDIMNLRYLQYLINPPGPAALNPSLLNHHAVTWKNCDVVRFN